MPTLPIRDYLRNVKPSFCKVICGHDAYIRMRFPDPWFEFMDFVYTHAIEVCDTLIFTHEGGSDFKILRYKANGCMPNLDLTDPEARLPLGSRRYLPWDFESEYIDLEPPPRQSNDMPPLSALTWVLIASDLERGLNLPNIWWKTHVEDADSIQAVSIWVEDDTWTMWVKIEAENVWICRGWKTFAHANGLYVGTACKFYMLPWPTPTFSVTFS
ncbi:putative B3 domain-containing protein isoform X2 [Salvia divinorum]|uniref:B3 domain-containing protein isoform X2 n=1 Tax=Salvia divinorum TaxID=28513 RepID=A0ABD1HL05_SALDI